MRLAVPFLGIQSVSGRSVRQTVAVRDLRRESGELGLRNLNKLTKEVRSSVKIELVISTITDP